jgi:hypothetical protein
MTTIPDPYGDDSTAYGTGDNGGSATTREPVVIAQLVSALAAIGTVLGWSLLDSAVVNAVISAIAAIVAAVATVKARASVTPTR